MKGVHANTMQQAMAQQVAEINNLRQEFEAQMDLSANIITQLNNKLTQLDTPGTEYKDSRLDGRSCKTVKVPKGWQPICNDSGSGALVDQGVLRDLGDRIVDRVNAM